MRISSFAYIIALPRFEAIRFTPRMVRRHAAVRQKAVTITMAQLDNKDEAATSSNRVCFSGQTSINSEPVAMPVNLQHLNDFFLQEKSLRVILSETGDEVKRVLSGDQEFFEVDTAVIHSKGLLVSSTSVIDAQLSLSSSIQDYPSCTFDLIDSRISAMGAAPLVWLFDNLTLRNMKGNGKKGVTTSSTTRISCEQTVEGHLVFTGAALIEVNIRIPNRLLKFVSTKGMEEQGSLAMQSFVEKKLGQALVRFRAAYLSQNEQMVQI